MSGALLWSFFLSGLVLGAGWCTLSCGPLLLPFVADPAGSPATAFKRTALFHAGKILSYVALGGLVGYSTNFIGSFQENRAVPLAGGAFLFLLAVTNLFVPVGRKKRWLNLPPVGAGAVLGLLPCGPLTGFLVYLGYAAGGIKGGLLGGLAFGIGNLLNPLLLCSPLLPRLGRMLSFLLKHEMRLKAFYSAVFLWWSFSLVMRAFR